MKTIKSDITIADYLKKVEKGLYLPQDSGWHFSQESQIELEGYRYSVKRYKGYLRIFAANVTKNWTFPKKKDKNEPELTILTYIDKRFFTRILLYFCFISAVEQLVVNKRRLTVDTQLRRIVEDLINQYLSTKPRKRYQYAMLSAREETLIIDEFINNFWDNLIKLRIVNLNKRGVLSLNPDETVNIFDDLLTESFNDYPCIYFPKNWEFNPEDRSVKDGGYYINTRKFITADLTYAGKVLLTQELVDLINKLQKTAWSFDIPEAYLESEFPYDKTKFVQDYADEGVSDIQHRLHVYYFLKNFYPRVLDKKIYFPFNLDFRGRVYSLASYYSPTSSKKLRLYINTAEPVKLLDSGVDWLKIKIAHILGHKYNNYSDTLNNINLILNNQETLNVELNKLPKTNYKHYLVTRILNDIKQGESKQIVQFDATASVLQIIAVLFNIPKLMEYTNLTGENANMLGPSSNYIFKDIYTYILDKALASLPHPSMNIFSKRDIIKGIIMPLPYGKTEHESVNDLVNFLQEAEADYLLHNTSSYQPFIDLSLDELKQIAPRYVEGFDKRENKPKNLSYYKKFVFSSIFYKHLRSILLEEFPQLQTFEDLFFGKNAVFNNDTYINDFLTFESKYYKSKTYYRDSDVLKQDPTNIERKRRQLAFRDILTNEIDTRKKADAPNYIHSLDAWILYKILTKNPNISIYPIHDCIIFSPTYANSVLLSVQEAYKEIQEMAANHPVFKRFHENGSVPITSVNIFKFEFKEDN